MNLRTDPLLIIACATASALLAAPASLSASAIWAGGTSGDWALDSNWSPEAYPDGSGENARFNDTVDTEVNIATDITVGNITHETADGTGHASGTITLSGDGSLTFSDPSGTASIMSQQSGSLALGNWVGPIAVGVSVTLDVDTFNIGASVSRIGFESAANTFTQMTAAPGRDVTVNVYHRGTSILTGENDFGDSGVLNVLSAGSGSFVLRGPNSVGGASTVINVSHNDFRLEATEADGGNFGNKINILNSGTTGVLFQSTGTTGPVEIGSFTVGEDRTVRLFTTAISGGELRINSGESMSISSGSVVYLDNFNNIRKGDLFFSDGSVLTGSGTIATNPSNDNTIIPRVQFESGSMLRPGDGLGSTAILNVGSATYDGTEIILQPGAIAHFGLNGTTAGADYDQIRFEGQMIMLDDAVLDFTVGYAYQSSDVLTLFNNISGIFIGEFAGWSDGSHNLVGSFEGYDYYATISYQGGIGDITLSNFTAIPEPGTVAVILSLVAGSVVFQVRRRRLNA